MIERTRPQFVRKARRRDQVARVLLRAGVMLVSSLVLTTEPNAGDLLRLLELDERIQVGEASGTFLPVVATTHSLREARDLTEALQNRPGVRDLQLVAWFDDSAFDPATFDDHALTRGTERQEKK